MTFLNRLWIPCLAALALPVLNLTGARAQGAVDGKPIPVKITRENGAFHLMRDGKPYFIKGAGGDGSKPELKRLGANSFRTWGSDNLGAQLDAAEKLGMTVTIGIWLGHPDQGFDYGNAKQVADQLEMARQAVLKYRNHPALLMWGIGNEMENGIKGDTAPMWNAVNAIAAMVKQLDPNHPTMTVIAEIGDNKVKGINQYGKDIDVIGINSYGGGPSIPTRYAAAGGVKPYVITEFGPPGTWESPKNSFNMSPELTSTEKAKRYAQTWSEAIAGQKMCLGGYAFTWGNKQEASATWFGMLLPDGSRLGAADALEQLWTGKAPAHPVPNLETLKVVGSDQVSPGATVEATIAVSSPGGDPLKVEWLLSGEGKHLTAGEAEPAPSTYTTAIVESDAKHAKVKMPEYGGNYRLFAFVRDTHGGAAVANVPLLVKGGADAPVPAGRRVKLPFTVYSEASGDQPFIPSGYMGNTSAIKMQADCTDNPHAGKTCLKVDYSAKDNWAGVFWQDPANDWGDKMGGANLAGATRLTFWARGEKGGEAISFFMGGIASNKPFFDTAEAKLLVSGLTKEWKQYSIDLRGKDLSRIKSGFGWSLAANGSPITFYLDDVRYEGATAGDASVPPGKTVKLPFAVYAEAGGPQLFAPSGYMGNSTAIKMDDASTTKPHTGKTCLKVEYTASDNWGGVFWQDPANDWGDKMGGANLTGASKLSFWVRGEKGGEEVTFFLGGIASDKPYFDTTSVKPPVTTLTQEWKRVTIDLTGRDLTRIKSGFGWSLAAKGSPITFYLDDIVYE